MLLALIQTLKGKSSNRKSEFSFSLKILRFHDWMNVLNGRFFRQYLLLLCVNQMASGLLRLMAALGRNIIVANTFGSFALLAVLVMGGFVLSKGEKKKIFSLMETTCSFFLHDNDFDFNNENCFLFLR